MGFGSPGIIFPPGAGVIYVWISCPFSHGAVRKKSIQFLFTIGLNFNLSGRLSLFG